VRALRVPSRRGVPSRPVAASRGESRRTHLRVYATASNSASRRPASVILVLYDRIIYRATSLALFYEGRKSLAQRNNLGSLPR